MPTKSFLSQMFYTTGWVSSKQVAQMYEEEIHFGKLFFNDRKWSDTFDPYDLDLWPQDHMGNPPMLPMMDVWTEF